MPDTIKQIADKVITSMRTDKCTFDIAFSGVMQNYKYLDWVTTKSNVGSELGKRRKSRKLKPTPRQAELPFGVSRAQALRDAAEHAASLTRGIPEEDL